MFVSCWFVSLLVDDYTVETLPPTDKKVGIDVGISSLLTTSDEESQQGSWTPLIVVLVVLLFRWLAYGTSDVPVRFRLFYSMQVSIDCV